MVALTCSGFSPADWETVPNEVNPTPCVIDASGAGDSAFRLQNSCSGASSLNVNLFGLTIRNGKARGEGGAIRLISRADSSSLHLDVLHSVLQNNAAVQFIAGLGGAIYVRCCVSPASALALPR